MRPDFVCPSRVLGRLLLGSLSLLIVTACEGHAESELPAASSVTESLLDMGRLPPEFELGGPAADFDFVPVLVSSDVAPAPEAKRLSELRGEVVVLDFWASWCRGCILEHPMMVDIGSSYPTSDVHFFGITEDSNEEIVQFAARRGDFSYPMLHDDGTIAESFGIVGWPTKVVIARDGSIVWWQPGGPQPRDVILAAIDSAVVGGTPVAGPHSGFPIEQRR